MCVPYESHNEVTVLTQKKTEMTAEKKRPVFSVKPSSQSSLEDLPQVFPVEGILWCVLPPDFISHQT